MKQNWHVRMFELIVVGLALAQMASADSTGASVSAALGTGHDADAGGIHA